jgi:Domain of unknown function (DU1801)
MNIEEQIATYIASQPAPKGAEMEELHQLIRNICPTGQLWFFDGKDSNDKIVSNPTIGYGHQTITYAGGKTRPFFQIGMSANTTGISIYLLGLKDKTYLSKTYGDKIGKASVSGYCIKFKTLQHINMDVLKAIITYGFEATA